MTTPEQHAGMITDPEELIEVTSEVVRFWQGYSYHAGRAK